MSLEINFINFLLITVFVDVIFHVEWRKLILRSKYSLLPSFIWIMTNLR